MHPELRVTAITNGRKVPSARFRVEQFIAPLERRGIEVAWRPAPISKYAPATKLIRPLWFPAAVAGRVPGVFDTWRSSVTWLGRELVATTLTLEPLLKRPVILDVDDAIWLPRGGWGIRKLVNHVDRVFAGNGFIADWFSARGLPVEIIPTAVDVDRFRPAAEPRIDSGDGVVIGWTGTSSNHNALEMVAAPLKAVLEARPRSRLLVVSDKRPRLDDLPGDRVDFRRWSPANEAETVRTMDIGIMPLLDTEWSRGKCSYKMLLYMACGLPVVVSPIGMNVDILKLGEVGHGAAGPAEWVDALVSLIDSEERRRAMGQVARDVTARHFSVENVAELIARGLRNTAGR
jgi:glycosyltransferase involved in cell wall biosynthesis